MKELALTLPGSKSTYTINNPTPQYSSAGSLFSGIFQLMLYVALFLAVAWIFWGIFQYVFAGGDKNKIGQARNRIVYAIIGFMIIIISFAIKNYVIDIFGSKLNTNQTVTNVTLPTK